MRNIFNLGFNRLKHVNFTAIRCVLKCADGFTPTAGTLITCLANGRWNGNPMCREVQKASCLPYITGITNGKIGDGCKTGLVDDVCSFTCDVRNFSDELSPILT